VKKRLLQVLGILSLAGLLAVLLDPSVQAALTSQVNSYVNGNILTASQLNSEFGNIYSTINNLDNANLSSSANISPAKISSAIDGTAISRDAGTGALSVAVDDSTIETNSDTIRLKDSGITTAKILDANVTLAKMATDSVSSAKIVDATIVAGDLASNAVTTAKITDANVTKPKLEVKTGASSTATVGMVAVSSSSGTSTTSVASGGANGDIANNSVTITTNGSPVFLTLTPGPSATVNSSLGGDNGYCRITFSRGGTVIARMNIGSGASGTMVYYPPGSFQHIDVVAAGTYTYKASYITGCDLEILNVRLMAYEL
jgi:hypothetical protein